MASCAVVASTFLLREMLPSLSTPVVQCCQYRSWQCNKACIQMQHYDNAIENAISNENHGGKLTCERFEHRMSPSLAWILLLVAKTRISVIRQDICRWNRTRKFPLLQQLNLLITQLNRIEKSFCWVPQGNWETIATPPRRAAHLRVPEITFGKLPVYVKEAGVIYDSKNCWIAILVLQLPFLQISHRADNRMVVGWVDIQINGRDEWLISW